MSICACRLLDTGLSVWYNRGMTMKQTYRFSATSSAGGVPGKPFGVFDKQTRKVVSHHRTAAQAMAAAQRRNRNG